MVLALVLLLWILPLHAGEDPPPEDSEPRLLHVDPAASAADKENVLLGLRAGAYKLLLRVECNDEEVLLRQVGTRRPMAAPGAEQAVLAAAVGSDPPEPACGVPISPGVYTEILLERASPAVSWKVRVQRADGTRADCWHDDESEQVWQGWAMTDAAHRWRSPFEVVVVADSHLILPIYRNETMREIWEPASLRVAKKFVNVAKNVLARCGRARNAFVLQMGDPFDFHGTGDFMPALATMEEAEKSWSVMRQFYSKLSTKCGPLYNVIGNWEGETACSGRHVPLAEAVRNLHFPMQPGVNSNWYTVSHGPLFVVVLHVTRGSPRCHSMEICTDPANEVEEGRETDFALGPEQQAFVQDALYRSAHEFKIVAVHHPFGGAAMDELNTWYGRGGAKAAKVGEQGWLHELMVSTGVQVFLHAHDHVFNDEVVDGIHYTCVNTISALWKFAKEGNYSSERMGGAGKYGSVRLVVSHQRPARLHMKVLMLEEDGRTVGHYIVEPNPLPSRPSEMLWKSREREPSVEL